MMEEAHMVLLANHNEGNTTTGNRDLERFNIFDFLRLCAASLVLYSHSYPLLGLSGSDFVTKIFHFTDGGQVGVLTFFAISGYLNTQSINRTNSSLFLFNRALRIFPGLIVALLFGTFLVGPVATNLPLTDYIFNKSTWLYLCQNSLLSPNYFLPGVFTDNLYKIAVNGSLWTLPAEFCLYLCLPVIANWCGFNKRGMIAILSILLLAIILSYSIDYSKVNTIVLGNANDVLKEAFVFFVGSLLSYDKTLLGKRQLLVTTALILLLSCTSYASIAFIILFPSFVISVGLLDLKLLRLRNDISYGVYIYAFQIQQLTYYILHGRASSICMAIISAVATYLIAAISWFIIEKPILRNRKCISSMFFMSHVPDQCH